MKAKQLILFVVMLLGMVPCTASADDYVPLDSIELMQFNDTLKTGGSDLVFITKYPENATCDKFTLESSDSSVMVACFDNGNIAVNAYKAGVATITVTSVEENPKSDSVTFTVINDDHHESIDSIVFCNLPDTIKGQVTFQVKLYPDNSIIIDKVCTVSDPEVLGVEFNNRYNEGYATAFKSGVATVTITTDGENPVSCSKTVVVVGPFDGEDTSGTEPKEFLYPDSTSFVDIDITDQSLSTDWKDSTKVTQLLKQLVPSIPDNFWFKNYRTNTDIKGYTHYDCRQMDANGYKVDGCELIAHVDQNGKLLCLTGQVAYTTKDRPFALSYRFNCNKSLELDLSASQYNQKAELNGDLYYYSKGHYSHPVIDGATDGRGTYVLQDPGRLYTLDYSNAASKNFISDSVIPTLKDALNYGDNFTSNSATFSEGYQGLSSKVKNIIFSDFDMLDGDEYTLDIRKCKASDLANVETKAEAWSKGTTIAKLSATSQDNAIIFTVNDISFDVQTREQDPEGKIEDYLYFYQLATAEGDTISTQELTIEHDNTSITYKSALYESVKATVIREVTNIQPALNIHWGLERVLDVYKQTFHMNSFDNHGSPVIALVNTGNADNANYDHISRDGCGIMLYGLGSFSRFGNYSSMKIPGLYAPLGIETMGHEFTHIVTNKLSPFNRDSYALGESYADIMGLMVQRKVLDDTYSFTTKGETINYVNWNIGQIAGSGSPMYRMRRFDDPTLDGHPKYYKGAIWNSLKKECHRDAGVQNHWFYLLCTGGEVTPEKGEKITITAIPRDSAELITFGSLMYFTTKNTDYPTARKNSLHVAEMYFGPESQEVKSVLAAWYAVGVGTDEWKPGDTGIEPITTKHQTSTSVRKQISDKHLVIVKNGVEYNAAGQRIK